MVRHTRTRAHTHMHTPPCHASTSSPDRRFEERVACLHLLGRVCVHGYVRAHVRQHANMRTRLNAHGWACVRVGVWGHCMLRAVRSCVSFMRAVCARLSSGTHPPTHSPTPHSPTHSTTCRQPTPTHCHHPALTHSLTEEDKMSPEEFVAFVGTINEKLKELQMKISSVRSQATSFTHWALVNQVRLRCACIISIPPVPLYSALACAALASSPSLPSFCYRHNFFNKRFWLIQLAQLALVGRVGAGCFSTAHAALTPLFTFLSAPASVQRYQQPPALQHSSRAHLALVELS
jgi:hypothetical protein